MNQLKISFINKVELWLISILALIAIFYLLNVIANPQTYNENIHQYDFESRHLVYSYFTNYFLPFTLKYVSLYGCYLLLHFIIVKNLAANVKPIKNIALGIGLLLLTGVVWGLADILVKNYLFYGGNPSGPIVSEIFSKSFTAVFWIYFTYAIYTLLKYSLYSAVNKFKFSNHAINTIEDVIILITFWTAIQLLLNMPGLADDYRIMWVVIVLPAIPVYAYAYGKLIPIVKSKKKDFWYYLYRLTLIAVIIIILLCVGYSLMIGVSKLSIVFLLISFCIALHIVIISTSTWFVYHYRQSKFAEITGLKTALGQSNANLDFLRSQINPHFLFNALNTLYGTALQENADRTGTGIQKLGDMMRFMLQENVQEQISLTREIDYLNNYIDLQKLRTQTSPDIIIDIQIDEQPNGLQIAPMLLIPFVENAFKHGISLRQPSHIKITLHKRDSELLFDVTNTIHPKSGADPEKDKSGIGLKNIQQRLQLLYPNRHDLVIRESAKEFFIHLTIQL
ncbi:MAG: histidine kinase [Mucilaginibacter sp.]